MTEYTLMPGKPYEGTEEETMETIRAVLTEEEEAKARAEIAKSFVDRTVAIVDPPRRRSSDLPVLHEPLTPSETDASETRKSVGSGLTKAAKGVVQFRPTSRHLMIVTLLLLIVVRPQWFVVAGAIVIAFVLGLFLAFGAQRIWGILLRGVEVIEQSDTTRGARLRTSLDRFACRWDRILDMLPDGMADSLYMPDFQKRPAEVEAQHAKVVEDRLARMKQEG